MSHAVHSLPSLGLGSLQKDLIGPCYISHSGVSLTPTGSPRIHSRFSLAVLPAVIAETAQKPGLDAAHICPCLTFYSQKTMLNQMVSHLRL